MLVLLACTNGPGTLTCDATVNSTIETVIGVEWAAPEGSTSFVEFGEEGGEVYTTPDTTDAEVHRDLVGVPADTDVSWRGVSNVDGATFECTGSTRTGSIPSDLPEVTVATDADGQQDSEFVIGAFFSGAGGRGGRVQLAAFRRDGEVVWYYQGDEDATSMDLHYSQDGRGILFNQFDGQMGGEGGTIHLVSLAGEILQTWEAPLAHHMFTELPGGGLAYQQIDVRTYPGRDGTPEDWVGDAIAELPAEGGEPEVVFSTWDAMTPTWNLRMERSIYDGLDWTHGNNVVYSEAGDEYLLSLGHANDVLRIDREGAITTMWGIDGVPADPAFDYQHDVHLLPNGNVLMFSTSGAGAGAFEYTEVDGALTLAWSGVQGERPLALGQARRLPNGNTMVNEGAGGKLHEETSDGETVWELATDGGPAVFAQFQVVANLYTGAVSAE